MSEYGTNERRRRVRYSRHLRAKKAVSPVVATLILILIAVAAAAALYLWLVAWQGGVTKTIGSPGAQYTVTIGGSTSVYPFDTYAVAQFEQNNTDVAISNNQGGTGAGMAAVCAGQVDIGTASSLETQLGLESTDGCPTTATELPSIQTVAYDAVDIIVQAANDHGLVSVSYDTVALIYDHASVAAGSTPTLNAVSINGDPIASTVALDVSPYTQDTAPATYTALEWNEIPSAVLGATVAGCGVTTETVSTVAADPGVVNGAATACGNGDIYTPVGDASSCGFTICAGPFTAIGAITSTDTIVTVARSDASGTTQTFEARILAAASASSFETSFSGLGFSGCGSNNYISDCGLSATKAEDGNPGVISEVASSADAIGYASDGLARASGSGVTCEGVATSACGIGLEAPSQGVAVQPALGGPSATTGDGTIANGAILGGFGPNGATTQATTTNAYPAVRPFEFVTLGTPTGEVERFIQFVLDPANNQNFATESAEVSLYSV